MHCKYKYKDEFDYRAALKDLNLVARHTYGKDERDIRMSVSTEVSAEALISIAKSLRHIESHMCDKAGGGTPAS